MNRKSERTAFSPKLRQRAMKTRTPQGKRLEYVTNGATGKRISKCFDIGIAVIRQLL